MNPQLSSYEVQKELGRGGMGVVYAARHRQSRTEVVIKLMLARSPSPEALERFRREALALAALSHPSVVRIKELGEHEGRPFFVMERIFGSSLKERIEASIQNQGRVPPFDWTAKIFSELASALAACHRQGITHRDLKPENIVIEDGSERPVLLDFGLVKRAAGADEKELESLTKTGTMIGTPQYMAPEQLDPGADFGEVGSGTDIWGLGGCMVFALTGRPPVESRSQLELVAAIIGQDLPLPRTRDHSIPRWLNLVCGACLNRDSRVRPSAEELVAALGERNAGSLGTLRPIVSGPVRHLALGLVVLLALIAGLVYTFQDHRPPVLHLAPSTPSFSKTARFTIRGLVIDAAPALVTINKEAHKVSPSGAFRVSVHLEPGANVLSLRGEDERGNRSPPIFIRILFDKEAPRITIKELPRTIHPLRIHGTLSEEGCRIRIGKDQGKVTGRSFEFSAATISPGKPLTVIATDPSGNTGTLVLSRLAVVQANGAGTHPTLPQALRALPAGGIVLLQPGEHRVRSLLISRAVSVLGDRGPGDRGPTTSGHRVQFHVTDGPITVNPAPGSGAVRLEGLNLHQDDPSSDLVVIRRGRLELRNCEAHSLGGCAIRLKGESAEAEAELHWKSGLLFRGKGAALVAERGRCLLEGLRVIESDSTGGSRFLDSESKRRTGAIEVLAGASVTVNNCQIDRARDRAFSVAEGGRLEGEKTTVSKTQLEGIYLRDGELALTRWIFKGCGGSGIRTFSSKALKLVGCSIEKCGARLNSMDSGLSVSGGAIEIVDSVFIGNSDAGIHARSGARVSATNTRFEGNLVGVSCRTRAQATLSRCILRANKTGATVSGNGARILFNDCEVSKNRGPGAACERGGTLVIRVASFTENGLDNSGAQASGVWASKGGILRVGTVSFTKNTGYGIFVADQTCQFFSDETFDLTFKDNKLGKCNFKVEMKR